LIAIMPAWAGIGLQRILIRELVGRSFSVS